MQAAAAARLDALQRHGVGQLDLGFV